MLRSFRLFIILFTSGSVASQSAAQYVTSGGTVTETFDNFAGTGFRPSPAAGQLNSNNFAVTGWSSGDLDFGGTQTTASTDYTRGASSGGVSSGGFYAFTVATGNVGLGFQPGNSDFAPGAIYVKIKNTGAAFTGFTANYTRGVFNDQGRSSSLNFSYAVSSVDFSTAAAVGSLPYTVGDTFTSPTTPTALPVWSLTPVSVSDTTTAVATNSFIYLRWSSADVGSSSLNLRDEFAIASFSLTPVPEPATVLVIAAGGLGFLRLRRRRV